MATKVYNGKESREKEKGSKNETYSAALISLLLLPHDGRSLSTLWWMILFLWTVQLRIIDIVFYD